MFSLKNALVNTVQLPCIHAPKVRNDGYAITLDKVKRPTIMISLEYLTPEIFDNCPELFSTFDRFLMLSTKKKKKRKEIISFHTRPHQSPANSFHPKMFH